MASASTSTTSVPKSVRLLGVAAPLLFASIGLNPFASGPNPDVDQSLYAWVVLGLMLCLGWVRALPRPLWLALLLLGLWIGWRDATHGLNLLAAWGALAAIAMGAMLGAHTMAHDDRPLWWAQGLWLAAVLSSVAALCQFFHVADLFFPWVAPAPGGQAYANLRQPNQFATLNNLGLVSVLFWLFHAPQKTRSRLFLTASVAFIACGTAASFSRTGAIQLAGIALAALCVPRLRKLSVLIVASYLLAAWALPEIAQHFLHNASDYNKTSWSAIGRLQLPAHVCENRSILWQNSWTLISEKPWLGWGWHEFAWAHYMGTFEPRFCHLVDNAHNLPLHLAVELGIPAALLVGVFLLGVFYKGVLQVKKSAWHAWALGLLLVLLLHSGSEFPLWYTPFQVAFGLACGVLLSNSARVSATSAPFPLAYRVGVGLCLFALLTVIGLDYKRVSRYYLPEQPPSWMLSWNLNSPYCVFCNQRDFARLTTTPITPDNAAQIHAMALDLLHFSPEPRVISAVIESAWILGQTDVAQLHLARFKVAYPDAYASWIKEGQNAGFSVNGL